MPPTRRKLLAILSVVALLGAAAVVAWGQRHRLGDLPLLGPIFGVETSDPMTPRADEMSGAAGGHEQHSERPDADPRAPVALDLRRQQLINVRTAAVERERVARTVRTVGVVRYDETRLTDVNLKLEGWIRELHVDYTGRFVEKGEPLFTLYSPELLATQQEYLLALESRDQLRQSQIADVRSRAERLVETARQRMELWDLPGEMLDTLDATRRPVTAVTFRSPAAGHVIEKSALEGMHVAPGQTLYRIADLSTVWIEADIYEQEMPLVRVGQPATVTLDAYPGERFTARVVYIFPFVEENTRTVRVRVELANRNGRLRPGMYANVSLEAPVGMSLTIPANALLDSGTRQLVFVAEGGGYFQPRDVTAGLRLGDRVQILDGLKEGELVATGATFFLDSESQLRASVEGFEAPAAGAGPAGEAEGLEITLQPRPDPPRTGENVLEVSVRDDSGAPVTGADVAVTFFMAAMPAMNMPAMRSAATLQPTGDGVYRGTAQVLMGGRWDVTVDVSRDGERLGSRRFSVVAK